MNESFDIDSFLQQRAAEGEGQGEGEFTVSQADAARKLARFALPDTFSWVLKLVQAVVGYGCPRLEVTQEPNITTFRFCPASPDQIPRPESVVAMLVSSEIGGTAPLQRLALALRALVEQSDFSFLLSLNDGQGESRSLYAGHDFGAMDQTERDRQSRLREPGFQLKVSLLRSAEGKTGRVLGGILIGGRRDAALAQELCSNAYLSPVEIRLDGRVITELITTARFGFRPNTRPLIIGGLRGDWPALRAVGLERKVMSFFTDPRRALRSYGDARDYQAWYVLVVDTTESAELDSRGGQYVEVEWVNDGVVVQRERIRTKKARRCQLTLLISAQGLGTDLTGLRLQQSEGKKQRCREVFKEAVHDLERLFAEAEQLFRDDRDDLSPQDEEIRRLERSRRRAKSLTGLSVPLAFTYQAPPIGAAATLVFGALIYLTDFWPSRFRFQKGRNGMMAELVEDLNGFRQARISREDALPY